MRGKTGNDEPKGLNDYQNLNQITSGGQRSTKGKLDGLNRKFTFSKKEVEKRKALRLHPQPGQYSGRQAQDTSSDLLHADYLSVLDKQMIKQ